MRIRLLLHQTIWIIYFTKGLSEVLGIPFRYLNYLGLLSIAILFALTLMQRKPKFPHLGWILALGTISLVSGRFLNGYSTSASFFFFRQLILLQYIYFIIIVNERSDHIIQTTIKTVLFLGFLQIPAAIIKLILVGPLESYIGTMSMKEGSLTTVFTMVAFSYVFSRYLHLRDRRELILMFFFFLFAIAGEKRAVILTIPALMLIIYFSYAKLQHVRLGRIFRGLVGVVVFSSVIAFTVIKLNPTLNEEGAKGGTVDLNFAVDYIERYVSRGSENKIEDLSRPQALAFLSLRMLSSGPMTIILGEGAGKLSISNSGDDLDPVHYHYGIRYGARMGVIWVFMQIGFGGLLVFILFYFRIFITIRRVPQDHYHLSTLMGLLATLAFDFFFYSMVSIRYFVIGALFLTYYGIFYRRYYLLKNANTWEDNRGD